MGTFVSAGVCFDVVAGEGEADGLGVGVEFVPELMKEAVNELNFSFPKLSLKMEVCAPMWI